VRVNVWVLPALAVDLAAIALLSYGIYYRRHRRADLMFAYIALNVGIFAVSALLMSVQVELAIGFGLFGVLSIIRLRSDAISQREVGYYFISLALGLVNGIGGSMPWALIGLNLLLLATMFAADHPRVTGRVLRRTVVLDVVHTDPVRLRADLERRLDSTVLQVIVDEVDYVRDVMVVDVRFRAADGGPAPWPRGMPALLREALR
jgi:hypothetical protein